MVFKSKNIIRKCKYCDNLQKKNICSGRNRGYCRTCGDPVCLKKQYTDASVNLRKGRVVNNKHAICRICECEFLRNSPAHKSYCIDCVPSKAWRAKAHRYGIGKPQWDEWEKRQNGKCALCDKLPETVDHCHRTRRVRGLLCNACNLRIATLDMGSDFLQKAFKYIGEHNVSV